MLRPLLLVILPIAIYSTPPQYGQTPSGDPVEQQLWRAINAMYSYKFALAAVTFDSVMAADPNNIVAPFVAAANQWQASITLVGASASHDTLFMALDEIIPHYERLLENADGSEAQILLFMGSTYGLRARVALSEKRWLSVIYSGFRGWQMIKRAYALNHDLKDAYFPIGLFEYYAGASAAPVQFLARIVGIKTDKQAGLQKIDVAVREGEYAWIEAGTILAIIYLYFENDSPAAVPYTTKLIDIFPENYYFRILHGEQLVRIAPINAAGEYLDSLEVYLATAHKNQQLEWALKLATLRAQLLYRAGLYDQALELVNWVVANYAMEFDWHLGIALYIRGKIRTHQGQPEVARIDFVKVIALDNKTSVIQDAKRALQDQPGY